MSLDDFLKECKEKGATPLSYSEDTLFINGIRRIKWANPAYARAMSLLHGKTGSDNKDTMSRLYGSEVVIRTPHGFHHGELAGYDGKFFYLNKHCFSRKPMGTFQYGAESIFSEDAVVPAKDIISVSEIPAVIGGFADIEGEEEGDGSEFKFRLY